MTPDSAYATDLINNELFNRIMDDFEKQAINSGVYAAPNDNDTRQSAMAEVRAIRALRDKLTVLANKNIANAHAKGSVA